MSAADISAHEDICFAVPGFGLPENLGLLRRYIEARSYETVWLDSFPKLPDPGQVYEFGAMDRNLRFTTDLTYHRNGNRAVFVIDGDMIVLRPYHIVRMDDERLMEGVRELAHRRAVENCDMMATDFLGFLESEGLHPEML